MEHKHRALTRSRKRKLTSVIPEIKRDSIQSNSSASSVLEADLNISARSEPDVIKPIIYNPCLTLNATSRSPGLEHEPPTQHTRLSTFSPNENSSFFKFFQGIYNEYSELSAKKQRLFRRKCLSFLHELLDDDDNERPAADYSHQADVLNLSHSGHGSEDDKDVKPVLEDGYILPST